MKGKSWQPHEDDLKTGNQGGKFGAKAYQGYKPRQTIGWIPSCECSGDEPVPCTVLDPFAGAGTVGLVAKNLNHDAILVDISSEYIDLSQQRTSQDALPLNTQGREA